MQTDIYIIDKQRDTRTRIPALPEIVNVNYATRFQRYNIMDAGEINIPSGEALTGYSWDALFPGDANRDEPWIHGAWKQPRSYQQTFNNYRRDGTALQLMITGTPIYDDVFLSEFDVRYEGGAGDFKYSIAFITARNLTIRSISVASTADTTSTAMYDKRAAPANSATYTVKSGDCLWDIALRYLKSGARYTEIYNLNRAIIGNNPNLIKPGQVLSIPPQ